MGRIMRRARSVNAFSRSPVTFARLRRKDRRGLTALCEFAKVEARFYAVETHFDMADRRTQIVDVALHCVQWLRIDMLSCRSSRTLSFTFEISDCIASASRRQDLR